MKTKNIMLLAALATLCACSDSDYELDKLVPQEYHKIVYINNSGTQELTLYDTGEAGTYSISVFKGGSDPSLTASVDINVKSQSEVDVEYDDVDGTDYRVLGSSCYSFDATHLDFSSNDSYKIVTVTLQTSLIKDNMEKAPDAVWVLPIYISSSSDSINAEKDELFLEIAEVVTPQIGFTSTTLEVDQYTYGEAISLTRSISYGLDTDNSWDITCQLDVDEGYIDTYNAANGTSYQLLPDGYYTMPSSITLPSGTTTSSMTVSIEVAAMGLSAGDYMLPVRISETNLFEISSTSNVYPVAVRIMATEFDRTDWTAEANTEELTGEGSNGGASCTLDGDISTYWHSVWQTGTMVDFPFEIIVDTKSDHTFVQFGLQQRQSDSYRDTQSGRFYVSSDKENWTEVGTFYMEQVLELQTYGVTPTTGRYFKVSIETSYRGTNASLSEIRAYGI